MAHRTARHETPTARRPRIATTTTHLQLRNLSPATIYNYLRIVLSLAKFLKRPLQSCQVADLRNYAAYLKLERKVSTSYYNLAIAALRILVLAVDEPATPLGPATVR